MVEVERTFTVRAPLGVVVSYLRDFANAEAWDPGTVRCTRAGSGEIAVGTHWDNTSKFMGQTTRLDYELRRDESDHLTFRGTNKTATSTDDMTFVAEGESTRLTYQATITFNGWARAFELIIKPVFQRVADKTVEQLTDVLEALPGS
jgi:carbon monoxide dehydrogenase subunit G